MKEKLWKWIKRYGVTVWLVTAAAALLVSVSYAAYINLDIAKWVVSTGSGESSIRFSSNYLYTVDAGEENYSTRKITPKTETATKTVTAEDGTVTSEQILVGRFTVEVCNYLYGNAAAVNSRDINYTLTATLVPLDGELPSGIEDITLDGETIGRAGRSIASTLTAKIACTNRYTFSIPEELMDKVSIKIAAVPNDDTDYLATNQKKLAAEITFRDVSLTDNWSGKFIDEKSERTPIKYDGFNYEISGSGEGTVTITINAPEALEFSPWMTANGWTQKADNNSWGREVGGDDQPTAYMTQFYIKNREAFAALFKDEDTGEDLNWADAWKKLETLVTVDFEEAPKSTETTAGTG